ncbi:phosphotransferase [Devosia chinhatensis]|uniref:Aminoglycoside phosphotransferase n=1 Tax=Devosia chinhatensis TaxID=429727 RepID=A0A0F5FMP5_9HYPH|nr:phosphotransferase [Devosia chinhatensis]KKB10149.1 aminoglycoside phosphotransferase [Devosia chinhatensis]
MHEDQIGIDAGRVAALIRRQFPQFRDAEIAPLTTPATTNAIFRIGATHAARLPLRGMDARDCRRLLEAEARAIAAFHAHCPFPSPIPIGIGRPGPGFPLPWTVQTWIEGLVATPNGQSANADFALDLVHLIRALRALDLNGLEFDGKGRGGNLPDHDAWMDQCFSKSGRLLDVARLRAMWVKMRVLPGLGYAVMSHRDLIPANLLVAGGRLVGVLDAGAFGPADPALDLVASWHLLNSDRRALFRNALGVSELEWRRGAAWAFEQAMGLVWYYAQTNPVMSALGRTTLARLVEADDI